MSIIDSASSICNKPNTARANNLIQELNDFAAILKVEREKNLKRRIIKSVLDNCLLHENLEGSFKEKVEHLCKSFDLLKKTKLSEQGNGSRCLLGLKLEIQPLNYKEQNLLRQLVDRELRNSDHKIINSLTALAGCNVNFTEVKMTLAPSNLDNILVSYQQKLQTQHDSYVSNFFRKLDILETLLEIKSDNVPDATDKKIQESRTKYSLFDWRLKLVNTLVRIDICKETAESLTAYKTILQIIKKQQNKCKEEIEQVEYMKECYNQVDCKEYREILSSYINYKKLIERVKCMLNKNF